jgi:hypothetical protein
MQAAIPCKLKSQSTPTVYAWLLQSDVASLRFCFAFFGLDKRYRDFSTGSGAGPITTLTLE